jgi:N-acyl-D-amino-acid deacylase
MATYSHLIKGGTIIDGSGFPMAKGDIGLAGEYIKSVGDIGRGKAANTIDATGKYIMPGIIDITSHSDTHWTLFSFPRQENFLQQGITTIIGGTCGSSIAPLVDARAIRSISKWTDISKVNINWRSVSELFDELERHKIGVNFGTLIGYTTLRHNITDDMTRELVRPELESMKLMLKRSLDEGAQGLSIGLASLGSSLALQDEIVELAKVVAESGKIVSIHLRNEGTRLLASVVEAIRIARSSGAHVHIVHIKAIGRRAWNDLSKALTVIRKAQKEESLSISVDFFPYLRTGSLLYNLLPDWILEGGADKILPLLSDKSQRDNILESLKDMTLHYEKITIAEAQKDKLAVGKTIKEISDDSGLPPEEIMLGLLTTNKLGVIIFSKTLKSRHLAQIAKEQFSIFATDGVGEEKKSANLTHPRSYGAAPRFLNRAVIRGKILSWEEAVKKMTSVPASYLGLSGKRGLIKQGYFADLVIFDAGQLQDTATYSKPYSYPKGINHVFINGNLAIENGAFKEPCSGKILHRE